MDKLRTACVLPEPMPPNDDVSHGDIYHKLGSLEGKLETVLLQLGDRKSDLGIIFSRLREIEIKTAIGIGIAIAVSSLLPFIINAAAPKLHFDTFQQRQQ